MIKAIVVSAILGVASGTAAADLVRPTARPVLAVPTNLIASFRPVERPKAIENQAIQVMAKRAKGLVCDSKNIQGTVIDAIPGRIAGCGVAQPIKVRAVAGIPLSTEAIMDCTTAKAMARWVDNGVLPAFKSYKGGVTGINVAAHYSCRTRNNQPGAKISEHGKGRAVDVSGFKMGDGSTVTVLNGWNAKGDGRRLRKVHKAACGPFGTVLGPDADRYHKDHFHFDTAQYRSGSYCR